MARESDDATVGRSVPRDAPQERETVRNNPFSKKEAVTLTAHGFETLRARRDSSIATLRRDLRWDTMPAPPLTPASDALDETDETPVLTLPSVHAASLPDHVGTAHWRLPPLPPPLLPPLRPAPAEEVGDEDILDTSYLDDDTTQPNDGYFPSEEPTTSLTNRRESSREIYRLFLASEYAPALALADELIGGGDDDPMLLAIARECRESLGELEARAGSSAPPPDAGRHDSSEPPSRLFAGLSGKMTLEQLAAMMGMSLDQVLRLLERFVAMGVITLRPPPR